MSIIGYLSPVTMGIQIMHHTPVTLIRPRVAVARDLPDYTAQTSGICVTINILLVGRIKGQSILAVLAMRCSGSWFTRLLYSRLRNRFTNKRTFCR